MMKINGNTATALFASLFLLATPCKAQEENTDVDILKELSSRIEIHGFAEAGYTATDTHYGKTNTFDVKRAIVTAKARITDRWSFFGMYDFSSVLQEFYTDYRITRNNALNVRVGQFKTRLTMENPMSPTSVESIALYSQGTTYLAGGYDPLYGTQYGRDLGLDIYGQLFNDHLYYNFQIMNGQGINRKDYNNKKDIVLSLDYRPINGLRIVATGQKGHGTAVATSEHCPDIAVGQVYQRDRFSIGSEWKSGANDYWKHRSFTIRGEYLWGKDGNNKSYGWYLTTSIPVVDKLDVIASYDFFKYNEDLDRSQTNLIAGVQYWYYKKCRIQAQYVWGNPSWQQGQSYSSWKHYRTSSIQLQTQIAF
jgi:hypothetical protein